MWRSIERASGKTLSGIVIIIIIIIGGKGRQQLLIEPTITNLNLNKLQFTQLQMFCELV